MKKFILSSLVLICFLPATSYAYSSYYGSNNTRNQTYTPSYARPRTYTTTPSYLNDAVARNRTADNERRMRMDEYSRISREANNKMLRQLSRTIEVRNIDSEKKFLEGKVKTFCSISGSIKKCRSYCAKLVDIDKKNKLCQGNPSVKVVNP
jgi:PAB1-binding protein PBP1